MRREVVVQYFEGCPSWEVAVDRLGVAAGIAGVGIDLRLQRVESDQDAARLGFVGSPTVLVDGRDPFDRGSAQPAMGCRLYPTDDGPAGSPTVEQLAEALAAVEERRP